MIRENSALNIICCRAPTVWHGHNNPSSLWFTFTRKMVIISFLSEDSLTSLYFRLVHASSVRRVVSVGPNINIQRLEQLIEIFKASSRKKPDPRF